MSSPQALIDYFAELVLDPRKLARLLTQPNLAVRTSSLPADLRELVLAANGDAIRQQLRGGAADPSGSEPAANG